jgi:proteasome lid subunit RPN8/RPN11
MNVSLGPDLLEAMTTHARAAYPQEACGLLAGRVREATRFIAMENVLASETAYEMDPAQLASTFRSMRENGEDLVAIVHSHPRGAAEPSRSDLDRAFYPAAAQIIIDGQSFEIELRVIV